MQCPIMLSVGTFYKVEIYKVEIYKVEIYKVEIYKVEIGACRLLTEGGEG
jgi:hypothetical protein